MTDQPIFRIESEPYVHEQTGMVLTGCVWLPSSQAWHPVWADPKDIEPEAAIPYRRHADEAEAAREAKTAKWVAVWAACLCAANIASAVTTGAALNITCAVLMGFALTLTARRQVGTIREGE